jgi:hypothetical protein
MASMLNHRIPGFVDDKTKAFPRQVRLKRIITASYDKRSWAKHLALAALDSTAIAGLC